VEIPAINSVWYHDITREKVIVISVNNNDLTKLVDGNLTVSYHNLMDSEIFYDSLSDWHEQYRKVPNADNKMGFNAEQWKALLIKYVAHNAAAEGVNYATDVDLAPCDMLDMEFSEDEKQVLELEIFPSVCEWHD